jgi:enoyl-CoA hydratase/carnithine racemase
VSEPNVLLEKDGNIARLVFNRPAKSNAMSFDDMRDLVDLLHDAEEDDDVKVIILKGRGKSFCAGHDFDDVVRAYGLNERDANGRHKKMSQRQRLIIDRRLAAEYMAFQYAIKPIIAQVQGACVGMGMYLAELVDLVVCADTARFSHSEQRLGFAGNTWHLNTLLLQYGPKKTREMLLFGTEFDGAEAERIGMANICVPEADLERTTEEWAERVARNPRDALVTGKAIHQMALDSLGATQQFYRGYVGHTLGTGLRFEDDEYNFFRARRDQGTKQAFRDRDSHFAEDQPGESEEA